MEEVLQPVMFDLPSRDDIAKVLVTRETVEENAAPTLVPHKQSGQQRRKTA